MTLYKWSQIADNNATADGLINWQENQAPSSVNDSARQMMAAVAKYRDDVSGAIVTSGTSTAYVVSSFETFDSLAHLGGQTIAFTPHVTNGATVTLNVDSLGAKPLRSAPSIELVAGTLIQGTPYTALYNNSDAAWYLQNSYVNPYQVPIGGMMDYIGSSAPNPAFVLPIGQAISRATYSVLFTLVGTTYGSGDGSTTFNIPDLTGRVTAMKEAAATRLTTAGGGIDGGMLGAVGGAQNVTLTSGNIPSLTSTGNNSIAVASTVSDIVRAPNGVTSSNASGGINGQLSANTGLTAQITSTGTNSISVSYVNGSPTATKTVMPAIILNKILRVI